MTIIQIFLVMKNYEKIWDELNMNFIRGYILLNVVMGNFTNFFSFQQTISPSNNNMSTAAKNVIKTMLTISIVFVLCWTPNTIYFILYSTRSDILLSGPVYSFTVYAVFGNAIVNPFIYSVQYAPFQNQVKKLFCRNNREGDSVATASSIS